MCQLRPRFTVRRLMIAVAIVAFLFGLITFYSRSVQFSRIASDFNWRAQAAETTMGDFNHEMTMKAMAQIEQIDRTDAEWAAILDQDHRKAEHFRSMQRKYEQAARYPWLPLEPDPPEPH